MDNLHYILNLPIETNIGIIYPFTIKEYALNYYLFNILSVTKNLLLQQIDTKYKEQREKIEQEVKNFDVICFNEESVNLLIKLLKISFKTDNIKFDKKNECIYINGKIINRDNYDYIRNMIIRINNLRLPKQAKTKELQEWFDKARFAKQGNNKTDMEDIITSIMALTGYTPQEISEMTVYQINKLIARLNKIKEFDVHIQYLCAGADLKGVKLEHWLEHIEDKNEEDNYSISYEQFTNNLNKNNVKNN